VNFVKAFNSYGISEFDNFTQSAFIQSRNKIKPEVFKHLSNTLVKEFYTDNDLSIKLWKGFRLLAVDGSRINLPDKKKLRKIYGSTINQTGKGVAQARRSVLYDLQNKLILDSELVPLSVGEHSLALRHLEYAKKK